MRHAFARGDRRVGGLDLGAPVVVMRQEQHADGVMARRRKGEAKLGCLLGEEFVRGLHQDAGAVAGARVGADGAAMLEIEKDRQRVLDDLVRFAPLDVGNEADAAGILLLRRIEEPKALRAHRHFRAPPVTGVPGPHRGFVTSLPRPGFDPVRGEPCFLEATFVPLDGLAAFVVPPSDVPSPSAAGPARLSGVNRSCVRRPPNWDSNAVL